MITGIRQFERNAEIVELARKVCEVNSMAFSANDANQSLADVGHAENVEDGQLLDAVGQRVGIRFREVEGSFRDLTLSAIETNPIIVSRRDSTGQHCGYFVILRKTTRTRFVVFFDGKEEIVSRSWLRKNAFLNSSGGYGWYLAQPMFADEAASAYNYQTGNQRKPLSPLRRLLAVFKA